MLLLLLYYWWLFNIGHEGNATTQTRRNKCCNIQFFCWIVENKKQKKKKQKQKHRNERIKFVSKNFESIKIVFLLLLLLLLLVALNHEVILVVVGFNSIILIILDDDDDDNDDGLDNTAPSIIDCWYNLFAFVIPSHYNVNHFRAIV